MPNNNNNNNNVSALNIIAKLKKKMIKNDSFSLIFKNQAQYVEPIFYDLDLLCTKI
jgi:hypothetical protein